MTTAHDRARDRAADAVATAAELKITGPNGTGFGVRLDLNATERKRRERRLARAARDADK